VIKIVIFVIDGGNGGSAGGCVGGCCARAGCSYRRNDAQLLLLIVTSNPSVHNAEDQQER